LITAQVTADNVTTSLPSFDPLGSAAHEASPADLDTGPDYKGLRRDAYYFFGYQFAAIAVLYVMPESISSWDNEEKNDYSLSKWKYNVTHPEWDSDDWFINYVLHPYWGAAYYVRGRERGLQRTGAFWYSTILSSVYEFGLEALFEEVSIQDVFITPIGGLIVGDYFLRLRDRISARALTTGKLSRKDKFTLVMTDPLGSLNRKTDQIFGRETYVSIDTFMQTRPLISSTYSWDPYGTPTTNLPPIKGPKVAFGIRFQLRF
jgi:hypothetical protein